MNDTIYAVTMLVVLASWLVGVVDTIRFSRYIRRAHPQIAEEHFPGILEGSIAQQRRTAKWMKSRGYAEVGDEELTRRADRHSKISGIASRIMISALVILVIVMLFFGSK
jgi:hypothetical protein